MALAKSGCDSLSAWTIGSMSAGLSDTICASQAKLGEARICSKTSSTAWLPITSPLRAVSDGLPVSIPISGPATPEGGLAEALAGAACVGAAAFVVSVGAASAAFVMLPLDTITTTKSPGTMPSMPIVHASSSTSRPPWIIFNLSAGMSSFFAAIFFFKMVMSSLSSVFTSNASLFRGCTRSFMAPLWSQAQLKPCTWGLT
mmetsp:Transcript_68277/g.121769  ORF Transcript_68277/g.121769 Transcript_68277/m.121769 type:complete len:201 (+) Transcript_68277:259-861(+)